MQKFIKFSDEEIHRANSVDIASLLKSEGEQLTRAGREYRWKRHESLTIVGNRWYHHSAGEGGLAINFVMRFFNLSFKDAIAKLLYGNSYLLCDNNKAVPPKLPFALPKANNDMRHLYAYLIKTRQISKETIYHFTHSKKLYESASHEAVFVGFDKAGIPRHAHTRVISLNGVKKHFNIAGSNSKYSFNHIGCDDLLFAFESPIDMMSYIDLHKNNWQKHSYLSLYGISDISLRHFLFEHPNIKAITLCLDNDTAGQTASEKIGIALKEKGYAVSFDIPSSNDWNEELKLSKGETK